MSAVPDLTQSFCEASDPSYEAQLRQSVQSVYGGETAAQNEGDELLKLGAAQQRLGVKLPPLLFHYGEQDVRFQAQYLPFKRFCEANRLPVTFATAPGRHNFDYWEPTIRQIFRWFMEVHQNS